MDAAMGGQVLAHAALYYMSAWAKMLAVSARAA